MKKNFNKAEVRELVTMLRMTQPQLKQHIFKELKKHFSTKDIQFSDGYIYCPGDIPVLMVCHLDIVGKMPPQNIIYNSKYITAISEILGGDDRCGCHGILTLLKRGYRPSVLFTEDEECGGIGVRKFVNDKIKLDVKYIVELDRRGHDDCVFYDTGNDGFIKYVETFGFKEQYGSFSDICTISPEYDIASVNLSCGYYKEHTTSEYIVLTSLYETLSKVENMLNDIDNVTQFDMQEIVYMPQNTMGNGKNNSYVWHNGKYITIQDWYEIVYGEQEETGYVDVGPVEEREIFE